MRTGPVCLLRPIYTTLSRPGTSLPVASMAVVLGEPTHDQDSDRRGCRAWTRGGVGGAVAHAAGGTEPVSRFPRGVALARQPTADPLSVPHRVGWARRARAGHASDDLVEPRPDTPLDARTHTRLRRGRR